VFVGFPVILAFVFHSHYLADSTSAADCVERPSPKWPSYAFSRLCHKTLHSLT